MTVAAVQMISTPVVEENIATVRRLLGDAVAAGAELVLLPEYWPIIGMHEKDKLTQAEVFGSGVVQDFMREQAKQHGVWLIGGTIPLQSPEAGKVLNTSLVFNPQGECVARYDKIHLFGFQKDKECYDEARTITHGDHVGFFTAPFGRVGLSVCYDLRFPELYRALGECALIVVPSAFTATTGQAHWEVLLRARAIHALPITALLLLDLGFGAREAARITNPFYHDQVKEFLAELPRADQLQSAVVMTWPLSFVAPEKHAFYGDRYHRIINISDDQIRLLYGYPRAVLQRPSDMRTLSNSDFALDDFLIFVNDVAARVPPIAEDNRTTLQPFFLQMIAVAENVTLRREGDDYRLPQPSPQPIMLLHADGVDATPLMAFDRFPALATSASQGLTTPPDELSLLAFRIYALCNLAGCSRY